MVNRGPVGLVHSKVRIKKGKRAAIDCHFEQPGYILYSNLICVVVEKKVFLVQKPVLVVFRFKPFFFLVRVFELFVYVQSHIHPLVCQLRII